jgi:hypothetical protein
MQSIIQSILAPIFTRIGTQTRQLQAQSSSEILHATPPSSPLPREGGRDFLLVGGVASGATSWHGHGGSERGAAAGGSGQHQQQQGQAAGGGGASSSHSELMEKVDFIGPAESMKGACEHSHCQAIYIQLMIKLDPFNLHGCTPL